jgi:hypothetical protein
MTAVIHGQYRKTPPKPAGSGSVRATARFRMLAMLFLPSSPNRNIPLQSPQHMAGRSWNPVFPMKSPGPPPGPSATCSSTIPPTAGAPGPPLWNPPKMTAVIIGPYPRSHPTIAWYESLKILAIILQIPVTPCFQSFPPHSQSPLPTAGKV